MEEYQQIDADTNKEVRKLKDEDISIVQVSKEKCVLIDHQLDEDQNTHRGRGKCLNNTVCMRRFNILKVEHVPISNDYTLVIEHIKRCCHCANYQLKTIRNKSELTTSIIEESDVIVPILMPCSKTNLYGYFSIPVFDIPQYIYITPTPDPFFLRVVTKMLPTIPTICIIFLFAIATGFFTWFIEWKLNSKEFPHPVFKGWFEGTWWSYISMSTVGYGDRTPRTIVGRIFAVLWIMCGITLFNILTGICTTAIQTSQETPIASIKNAQVGVLQHRALDAAVVAKHGGLVVETKGATFIEEIVLLLKNLREKKIDGIVLDQSTNIYVRHQVYSELVQTDFMTFKPTRLREEAKRSFDYLVKRTVAQAKSPPATKYYYGVLVKDREVYDYFHDSFSDNLIAWSTENNLRLNKLSEKDDGKDEDPYDFLSSTNIDYHYTVAGLVCTVGLIAVIAIFLRMMQKKKHDRIHDTVLANKR